jgi:site-specific recombinase XerD
VEVGRKMGRLSLERSPYSRFLLEDPNFRRWVSSVEEGSPNTAGVYFRRVGKVCTDLNKKPSDLATMNRQEAKAFIHDSIGHLRSGGNVGSTIAGYVKALKSWFIWNEVEIRGRVRVKGSSESPVYESEVPPKRPELRKILDVAKIRGRRSSACSPTAGSGPRSSGTRTATTG